MSLLAAVTMIGGVVAAGSASATTEPPGTEPTGTEAAGTEAAGTEAAGDEGPTGGAGRGSDSGLEGYDLEGTSVTVSGVEESTTNEGQAVQAALDVFAEENGMTITYTGVRSFEGDIGQQVAGGTPPDIGMFPQPGRIAGFAGSGDVLPLPDDIVASVSEVWGGSWLALTNVDGMQYGIPFKADLKSLVWYKPSRLRRARLRGPDDVGRRSSELVADDGRRRQHAAVRRHRFRRRNRLAVHGLDRGAGAAHRRASSSTTSGSPTRCRSTRRDRRRASSR